MLICDLSQAAWLQGLVHNPRLCCLFSQLPSKSLGLSLALPAVWLQFSLSRSLCLYINKYNNNITICNYRILSMILAL